MSQVLQESLLKKWRKQNNSLVSNIVKSSNLNQIRLSLNLLLQDLQSVPVLSMYKELEVDVAFNLVAISELQMVVLSRECIYTTLSRLISINTPGLSFDLKESTTLNQLLKHFFNGYLLENLDTKVIQTIMDIFSLLVKNLTLNISIVEDYFSLINKLEKYLLNRKETGVRKILLHYLHLIKLLYFDNRKEKVKQLTLKLTLSIF